jgi:general stress protein YciG
MTMKKKKQLTVSEMAKMGGKARAKSLTPERRKEIARKAIATRWAKKPGRKGEN